MDETFDLMAAAVREGARFLVTIEALNQLFAPVHTWEEQEEQSAPLDGPMVGRFADFARRHRVHVVAGLYTRRDGRSYNSALLIDARGERIGLFDKVHLPAGEGEFVTAGDRFPVFPTEHGNVGMLICWDMQYPEAARELALGGADLIACPTWGWENLSGLCRAYENSVTIAAAMGVCGPKGEVFSCSDPSCIVDIMGRFLAQGGRRGAQVVMAEVDIRAEPAPQYGAGEILGMDSMRQIRFSQRRPETYVLVNAARPPLADRYASQPASGPAKERR